MQSMCQHGFQWGLGVCFLMSISPHLPQIKNHHVPAPSGEHVKTVLSPGRQNTQMGNDLKFSTPSLPTQAVGTIRDWQTVVVVEVLQKHQQNPIEATAQAEHGTLAWLLVLPLQDCND